jgi:HK97 family phage major capsid protein
MDPQVKAAIDALNAAFGQFTAANDKALAELRAGHQTAETKAMVDKANADITYLTNELTTIQQKIREQEIENARVAPAGSPEAAQRERVDARLFFSQVRGQPQDGVTDDDMTAFRAYKGAMNEYLRRGPQALLDPNIQAALSTGADTSGGYWLQPATSARVLEWLEDLSPLRGLANVEVIGTDLYEGYYDLDEADSGWVGETSARSETNTPRIDDKFKIPVVEQYANPRSTQKMLDDSTRDVEGWLARKVANKFGKRESAGFVSGDGILQPMGFLTHTAGIPARTSVKNYRKIRRFTTGAAGAFKAAANSPADCFIDMITGLPSEHRRQAVFTMNQLTLAEVRKIKDTEGRYIFIPDFATNPNGTILGHSIVDLNDMPDIAADATAIMLANWKAAYTIIDHRVGMRVLRDPYTAKPYVQFYTTKRVGGDVVDFQAIVGLKFAV